MTPRRLLIASVALLQLTLLAEAEAGPRSRPVRTGQTTCSDSTGAATPCAGTRQDGDLRRGEARGYLDNASGTIRDKRAGLTWEKLSDDGSIHDKDSTYTWEQAFEKIADLNAAAFAGFTDWRLPNRSELSTLLNLGTTFPAISAQFNACTAGCTVLTCSCTRSDGTYWSSTSVTGYEDSAWTVNFWVGGGYGDLKTNMRSVRAVRGGSVPGM